jgi:hypothetical protein
MDALRSQTHLQIDNLETINLNVHHNISKGLLSPIVSTQQLQSYENLNNYSNYRSKIESQSSTKHITDKNKKNI